MRPPLLRVFWILAAAPLLLAPIRLQQGAGDITLTPSQATPGPRGVPAVALPSPTIIDVSPTRAPLPLPLSPSATGFPIPTAALTTPSQPALMPQRASPPSLPAPQATLCVRALGMVNDLAGLSMKQSGQENLVPLTIATAIAQVQAAQGVWPALEPLQRANIPYFIPNRAELNQALEYARSFCQNPALLPAGGPLLNRPR